MIEVPLGRSGFCASIDDEDYPLISRHDWFILRKQRVLYARTWDGLKMHRLILSAPEGVPVHHIDGNGLNNRRGNLKLSNVIENSQHRSVGGNNRTGVTGVSLYGTRFRVMLYINGKNHSIGVFDSLNEAIKARLQAEARLR
jgi:hypothetical protein